MPAEGPTSAAETLLERYEFDISCTSESNLEMVELTDFLKRSLAKRVLSVLQETCLELDENVPRVRLVIFKSAPSQLDYQGKPCTDLDGQVFIFTTEGPKNFTFRFGLLTENIRFLAPGGDA